MRVVEPGNKGQFCAKDFYGLGFPERSSALKESDTKVLHDAFLAFVTLKAAKGKPIKEPSVHARELYQCNNVMEKIIHER